MNEYTIIDKVSMALGATIIVTLLLSLIWAVIYTMFYVGKSQVYYGYTQRYVDDVLPLYDGENALNDY